MEVRKLYYEDSHLHIFSATVTGCAPVEGGFSVTLDATAFYPEGGGQACDTGFLDGALVLSVTEENNQVLHLCDRQLPIGAEVTGTVDWTRRFDLMQQHSGEHMVSGIIHRRYGYHNVGFHIGKDVITIDFDGPIAPEDLPDIEAEVNRAIWADVPFRCWYPDEAELEKLPYRWKKALQMPVRLVEIPGVDLCACCGTQVQRSGEVGLVKLLSCVKFHEGVRIEMVCGERAFRLLSSHYDQNKLVSQAFSAKPEETGDAARRVNEALCAEKFRAAGLQKRLFAAVADRYKGSNFALHFEPDLSATAIRELADTIANTCTTAAVLSGSDEGGYGLCIISRAEDTRIPGRAAIAALNGRGGGKPEAFQGSLQATRQEIETFFSSLEIL